MRASVEGLAALVLAAALISLAFLDAVGGDSVSLRHLAAKQPAPEAVASLEQAIAFTPSSTYAWASLAHARMATGDIDGAAFAVGRSLATGRFERQLAFPRLPLLSTTWANLDSDVRQQAEAQLRWLWALDRKRVLSILPPNDHWPFYRRAFAEDPGVLTALWP